jgi:predicted nuclease of predicted toxin-antitoxin system
MKTLIILLSEDYCAAGVVGVWSPNPKSIDLVRVQDVGLSGEDDPTILAWAAEANRILLTHDVATITSFAYQRISKSLPMPGVIEVRTDAQVGRVIEDILLLIDCSLEGELEGTIYYIPL